MVSSREGFLFSAKAAFGQGKAGVECSTRTSLNTSGEGLFGLFGGDMYNELRVEWNTFRKCLGCGKCSFTMVPFTWWLPNLCSGQTGPGGQNFLDMQNFHYPS